MLVLAETEQKSETKDGPGPVMVSDTLCPAVHILGTWNVYSRTKGIADYYWPQPFLGSGPGRGRSPVEWGEIPSVRPSVRSSPPPAHINKNTVKSCPLVQAFTLLMKTPRN